MGQNETAQLRLSLGTLRFEYEGREEFLTSGVPALVQMLDRVHASTFLTSVTSLQQGIEDADAIVRGVDDLILSMKKAMQALSDAGEVEGLRLQIEMDRLSKMMTTLSNIIKKMNETTQSIVTNLK